MKLFSGPLSLFTAKVRIALAEKGIGCERVDVPFSRAHGYSPKLPEMLALNPKGQVPVLVDGALAVYDSTIILEYLEESHPQPPLYPRDPADRARCRQAEAAADEIYFPHVWSLIRNVYYEPDPAKRSAPEIAAARDGIAATHRELDRALARREFLCGDFTVADIGYFLTTLFAANLGCPPEESLASLHAWLARMNARPSVRDEVAGLLTASARA
jgi:glutathione S-transferase